MIDSLTPGTMVALPSSLHSPTFVLIWSLSSGLISPVSPGDQMEGELQHE